MMVYQEVKCLVLTFFLSNYFSTNYAQSDDTSQPEVTIPQGTLQGTILKTRNHRNVSAFLGIPYAQPPTGNLRFASPVAAGGWNGTLNASVNSNMCPQISSGVVLGDEDCLYINVYVPQLPQTTDSSLLPVMVYVHGGAFKTGSQTSTNHGPGYLLDEDVIYVAMNYRLGPLGFLSSGDEVASGNWGLKDQVLALEWVRDYIEYFGGDPDQVTLFGESAGSVSVHLLTLSDTTIGLFQRYITQSGSALATWAYRPRAAYSSLAFELGTYVGCSEVTSETLISCLRTVNFKDILTMELQLLVWGPYPSIIWGPTDEPEIEGAFLTDSPSNLFAAGKIRDLPWISGVTRDEGLLKTAAYYEDEEALLEVLKIFDFVLPYMVDWAYQSDSGAAWVNATKSYYFNNDLSMDTSVLLANFTNLVSDTLFIYPAHKALQQHHAVAENPQYFYTFDYRGSFSKNKLNDHSTVGTYGVAHGDDLVYLFPDRATTSGRNVTLIDADYEIVDTITGLWTSFAINGIPTALALDYTTAWAPYSSIEDNYLRIGNGYDTASEVQYVFREGRMQFWASIDSALMDDTGAP